MNAKKRIRRKMITVILSFSMAFGWMPGNFSVVNAAIANSGYCGSDEDGKNAMWTYEDGVLTISGTGAVRGYVGLEQPWNIYADRITSIVIEDGITEIGDLCFNGILYLENIDFGNTLEHIGRGSFISVTNNLTEYWEELILPENITQIDSGAFSNVQMKKLEIKGAVQILPDDCFGNCCAEFISVAEGMQVIEDDALFSLYIKRLELPGTVNSVSSRFCQINDEMVIYGKSSVVKEWAEAKNCKYVDASQSYAMEDVVVEGVTDMVYTGSALIPELDLSYNIDGIEIPLYQGYDYEISYKNNVERGIATATITGLGCYKGTKEITYHIYTPIDDCSVFLEEKVPYDGIAKTPEVTVTYDGKILTKDIDYTVTYKNNIEEGMASAIIQGIGFYKGGCIRTFDIYRKSMDDAQVLLSEYFYIFDGTAKTPEVTVTYDGKTLTKDVDYTVAYENNIEEGTGAAIITGKNNYKNEYRAIFIISKTDVADANIRLSETEYTYDGTLKRPVVEVSYGDRRLEEAIDYELAYSGGIDAGGAEIIIIGKGIYKGERTISYAIKEKSIENADCALAQSVYTYDGSRKNPAVSSVTMDGKILVLGKDYTISYRDNIESGTAYAVITGTGNYCDSVLLSFVILPYSAGMEAVYDDGMLISDNCIYGITDDKNHEVELCGPSQKYITILTVPATISCEGQIYKVTSIGKEAFYKNTKLKTVTIGNNVKSIENYAFYGCKNIISIKMGAQVEIISDSAFRKCTKLINVTLPKSIDELGKNAFYGCSKLKVITINANSVIDIGKNAIKGISKKAVIKVSKKLVNKYKKKLKSKTGYKPTMKIKKK